MNKFYLDLPLRVAHTFEDLIVFFLFWHCEHISYWGHFQHFALASEHFMHQIETKLQPPSCLSFPKFEQFEIRNLEVV